MILGRVVWGAVRWLLAMLFNVNFTFELFIAGALLTAIPGIVVQLLLIPPVVSAVTKEKK